jgi:hypothetical protein
LRVAPGALERRFGRGVGLERGMGGRQKQCQRQIR